MQTVLLHTQRKDARTPAKSAVNDFLFLLDYTDHDRDKAEMMTDAAVIRNWPCKIGVRVHV